LRRPVESAQFTSWTSTQRARAGLSASAVDRLTEQWQAEQKTFASAHPAAKKALAETWGAEDKSHAQAAAKTFADLFGTKFPKAVAKITDDLEQLLAFYDYPAEHWVHLRTTNPMVI
jgi:transposase-like protein